MKSNITLRCATVAGTILAATALTAASAQARGYHHRHGHSYRVEHVAHHRAFAAREEARNFDRHQDSAWRTDPTELRHPDRRSISLREARSEASHGGGLQSGIASVYSGGRTANGEVARAGGLTAAHRTLPFGTMVQVTNRNTGRSVVVRINDRGPFVRGRVIDLTPAAARAIGIGGLGQVTLAIAGRG
jgi:rare lipoprotein A